MEAKTVVVVDDHHLVRAALKNLINAIDGFSVVAEGEDGTEVLTLIEKHSPDLILLDIAMRGMPGLEVLSQLRSAALAIKVIVLSMFDTADHVVGALRAGANGYLLKDSAQAELELALRYAIQGQIYLCPRVANDVVFAALSNPNTYQAQGDIPLTDRQKEILKRIANGQATKEIAWELGLSAKTVESHRAQIMEKLGISDVAGLVRYAIRHGLVSL